MLLIFRLIASSVIIFCVLVTTAQIGMPFSLLIQRTYAQNQSESNQNESPTIVSPFVSDNIIPGIITGLVSSAIFAITISVWQKPRLQLKVVHATFLEQMTSAFII